MKKKADTRGEPVVLSKRHRSELEGWLRDPDVSAKQARRGRIIELLAEGWTQADVSRSTKAGIATVGRVRRRYLEEGLESAVFGYVAPGREKIMTDSDESRVVAIACSDPPDGRAAWTLKLIAERAVVSGAVKCIKRETVRKILSRHGLKPWLKKNVVRTPTG